MIHLEKSYGSINLKDKLELYKIAKQRAADLGIPLVVSRQFFGEQLHEDLPFIPYESTLFSRYSWEKTMWIVYPAYLMLEQVLRAIL